MTDLRGRARAGAADPTGADADLTAPLRAGYLAAQAVLGIVLWAAVAASPSVRSLLELVPERHPVTDAFAFADLAVIVVGSAVGAWAVWRRRPWAVPVTAFVAGAVVYPTAYLVAWVAGSGGVGAGGLAIMVVVAPAACWVAWATWRASTR